MFDIDSFADEQIKEAAEKIKSDIDGSRVFGKIVKLETASLDEIIASAYFYGVFVGQKIAMRDMARENRILNGEEEIT